MMLWRGEMKKTLMTQRGIWVLLVCLVLKLAFLCAFPEQKDCRIVLSQKQYDKYLYQLYGENTREKSDWILAEYKTCKEVKDSQEAMQGKYARGELTDAQWEAYTQALTQADLHINSAQIFAEKAEQFLKQPEDIPPAHYIYEYGWQTVFALLQFPDVFLLFGLLVLTAQCFPAEVSSGMLPVLLAARNGLRKLFRGKLLVLLTVGLSAAVISNGLEWAVFSLRGWCNDAAAPLYSITRLAACSLELSLGGLCSVPRGAASGDAVASDPAVRPIRMVEEHHKPDFFRPVHSGAAATMGWNCSPLYPRRPVIRHPDAPVVGRICDESCVACGDRDGLQYRCGLLRRQKTRQGPKGLRLAQAVGAESMTDIKYYEA